MPRTSTPRLALLRAGDGSLNRAWGGHPSARSVPAHIHYKQPVQHPAAPRTIVPFVKEALQRGLQDVIGACLQETVWSGTNCLLTYFMQPACSCAPFVVTCCRVFPSPNTHEQPLRQHAPARVCEPAPRLW